MPARSVTRPAQSGISPAARGRHGVGAEEGGEDLRQGQDDDGEEDEEDAGEVEGVVGGEAGGGFSAFAGHGARE